MSKLQFTPLALSDLDDILDYIARERPMTAVAVIRRIRQACEKIARFPEMGQRRPEFSAEYRSFPVERWVVFYRIVDDRVEVHRVLDGSRDIDSLMGESTSE